MALLWVPPADNALRFEPSDLLGCAAGAPFPTASRPSPNPSSNLGDSFNTGPAAQAPAFPDLDQGQAVLPHVRHVFMCFKQPHDWPANPVSFDWGLLPRALRHVVHASAPACKALMTVCEGCDDAAAGRYNGDVLLFPDMLLYRGLTRWDIRCLVQEALMQPPGIQGRGRLQPRPLTGCHVFVCCQRTSGSRCHITGPVVAARLAAELEARGVSRDGFRIWQSCHLECDGRQCQGNVVVFGSLRSSGADSTRAGQGEWYHNVGPEDVGEVVECHLVKGQVVTRLWMGSMQASSGRTQGRRRSLQEALDEDRQHVARVNEILWGNNKGNPMQGQAAAVDEEFQLQWGRSGGDQWEQLHGTHFLHHDLVHQLHRSSWPEQRPAAPFMGCSTSGGGGIVAHSAGDGSECSRRTANDGSRHLSARPVVKSGGKMSPLQGLAAMAPGAVIINETPSPRSSHLSAAGAVLEVSGMTERQTVVHPEMDCQEAPPHEREASDVLSSPASLVPLVLHSSGTRTPGSFLQALFCGSTCASMAAKASKSRGFQVGCYVVAMTGALVGLAFMCSRHRGSRS